MRADWLGDAALTEGGEGSHPRAPPICPASIWSAAGKDTVEPPTMPHALQYAAKEAIGICSLPKDRRAQIEHLRAELIYRVRDERDIYLCDKF